MILIRPKNVFGAIAIAAALAGCNDDNEGFTVTELTNTINNAEEENTTQIPHTDIGQKWLGDILSTMQGSTGAYLIAAAKEHNVRIDYADNLNHRIGEFNPETNTIRLELPLGIETASPAEYQEMIYTGRGVMYEELDHAIRHHERGLIPNLSAQGEVDGFDTGSEGIARITAYFAMSEDAQIGMVPSLPTQLGMPENGYAIYYATTDIEMADTIIAGLKEGEYFHEKPDLIEDVFTAFYGTSTSQWYTLYYASRVPDRFIEKHEKNISLAQLLDDFRKGNDFTLPDFKHLTNPLTGEKSLILDGLFDDFNEGVFTAEAEKLTLNDLIRFKARMALPDNGRANHLQRVGSDSSFFREASPEKIVEAFEILISDTRVIQEFMGSCIGKTYLSDNARSVAQNNYAVLTQYLPLVEKSVSSVIDILNTQELDASSRIALEKMYRQFEEPLITPSKNRVTIYDDYIRGKRHDGIRLCF
jgi:hypothetical protein